MKELIASVSFSALSPFVLGYALYRLLVGRGAAFVPQDAFFLVGLVTSFSLAWGLSSCFVAIAKVRHLAVRPLERLASAAAYRMDRGSVDPFRLKTRVRELVSLVAILNRLFGSQDERVVELVALIHAFDPMRTRSALIFPRRFRPCVSSSRTNRSLRTSSATAAENAPGLEPPRDTANIS